MFATAVSGFFFSHFLTDVKFAEIRLPANLRHAYAALVLI